MRIVNNAYEQAKARQTELDAKCYQASRQLRSFPKLANGLTPDAVRESQEYQTAKAQYNQALRQLREFNRQFVKVFAKELRQERRTRLLR